MKFDVIAASNNREILNKNLLSSPGIESHSYIQIMEGHKSASSAYNLGLKNRKTDYAIFVHQDVYLPDGWFSTLDQTIESINRSRPDWGILGTFGVSNDFLRKGHVYSNGINQKLGAPFDTPILAQSVDELLIILNTKRNFHFDESLKGYHLYGTDICQTAISKGFVPYIVDLFCIHNSRSVSHLDSDFWNACSYISKKWKERLPLQTPCITIGKKENFLLRNVKHRIQAYLHKKPLRTPVDNPLDILKKLKAQQD